MAEIDLGRGYKVIVDDADLPHLSAYRWTAQVKKGGRVDAVTCISKTFEGKRWFRVEFMTRMIMSVGPDEVVDHINRNSLDNRRSNLRVCSQRQNTFNRTKPRTHNGKPTISKYKGVTRHVSRDGKTYQWIAQLRVDGKNIHLGSFATEEEAARARDAAAAELHGEFVVLNLPESPPAQTTNSRATRKGRGER